MFLDTSLYNTTLDRQATDEEYKFPFTYRATANDIAFMRDFQRDLCASLGEGSNFTIEFAGNAKV